MEKLGATNYELIIVAFIFIVSVCVATFLLVNSVRHKAIKRREELELSQMGSRASPRGSDYSGGSRGSHASRVSKTGSYIEYREYRGGSLADPYHLAPAPRSASMF